MLSSLYDKQEGTHSGSFIDYCIVNIDHVVMTTSSFFILLLLLKVFHSSIEKFLTFLPITQPSVVYPSFIIV
jgi:hypothetical protein